MLEIDCLVAGSNRVVWGPDGKRLATASWDKTGKLWDAATGKELLTLRANSILINSVSRSPDGRPLATASEDTTVQVYAMDIHELMNVARGRGDRSPLKRKLPNVSS